MKKRVTFFTRVLSLVLVAASAATLLAFTPVKSLPDSIADAAEIVMEEAGIETIKAEAAETYFAKPTKSYSSIVDALKSIGVDSSYAYREKIAAANGIPNYSGTAAQNKRMLELLNQGKLKKPGSSGSGSGISNQYVNVKMSLSVPTYRQYDGRWAGTKIGTKTLKQVGCLTTVLAMLYSYDHSSQTTPDKMIRKLSYSNNDVYWSSVVKLGYRVTDPYNCAANARILKKIYNQLANGHPVIVGAKNKAGQHWVIVVSYKGDRRNFKSSDFGIIDPNDSGRRTLKDFLAYKPTVYRLVY